MHSARESELVPSSLDLENLIEIEGVGLALSEIIVWGKEALRARFLEQTGEM